MARSFPSTSSTSQQPTYPSSPPTLSYNDDKVIARAKRLSLINTPSSSAAPHAPLRPLLTSIARYKHDVGSISDDEQPTKGHLQTLLRDWESKVWSVLHDLDEAEKNRVADALHAVDRQDAELKAKEAVHVRMHDKEMTRLNEKWRQTFTEIEDEWEAKLKNLKATFNAKLKEATNQADASAQAPPLPSSPPIATQPNPDLPTPATLALMQSRHTAQTAFLTQKVERLADQNVELRKAKAGDPSAQEVVRRKVDGIKSGYEIRLEHMTTKVEGLADTNAALRKELRECEAKRKMGDRKEEGEGGDVESVSKKVKN
jgi:hypothetical protein